MKKIIVIILLFVAIAGKSQENGTLSLFSDRDTYTSGETLLFKVFTDSKNQSGVVHLSLINARGKTITEVNKKITQYQADGFIYIPDSLKTGTYLLCVSDHINPFTTVKELFICNRFSGLNETTSILRAPEPGPMTKDQAEIKIAGLGKNLKTREKVTLSIQLPMEMTEVRNENLLISVSRISPGFASRTFVMKNPLNGNREGEKSGVILEGYAKDPATNAPFNKACILLSVADSIPGIQYYLTGEDGHFYFRLDNYSGNIHAVVQGFDPEKKRLLKIIVNNQDSLKNALPNFENSSLSPDLTTFTVDNVEATTLGKIFNYHEIAIDKTSANQKKDYPFYGVPSEVIHPDLFIDLPDFTEISRELLPGVKFRAYNRIPTMQILNPATQNYFTDQPLVLLNGIPVQDLNVIKNLSSKDIDRIELCRSERFYGNLSFQGVVAIYSAKKDYKQSSADDLVNLNMDAVQPDASVNAPGELSPNEPDLRKILLWKPNIRPDQTISIDFRTSDLKGNYVLIVRGRTRNGTLVLCEQNFEVN